MPSDELNPGIFTDSVKPLTDFLQNKFKDSLCVSDIRDVLGRQYVDLVQEGGGVHGIALAGYTYILEKMGIGFMKMAGTSAGSINTLLLNAVYTQKEAELLKKDGVLKTPVNYYETRSEKVLEYLAEKDLREMVDGHPIWQRLVLNIFTPKTKGGTIKSHIGFYKTMLKLGGIFFLLLLISAIALSFYTNPNSLRHIFQWITVISSVAVMVVVSFFTGRLIIARLLFKYAETLGINPGDNFEKWITEKLEENGIKSVADLNAKFDNEKKVLHPSYQACRTHSQTVEEPLQYSGNTPNLHSILEKIKDPKIIVDVLFDDLHDILFPDPDAGAMKENPKVELIIQAFEQRLHDDPIVTREIVIVSSDLTHEMKVEFPGMHKMYWGNDYSISPAKYVRASMSVPIFFKPFQVDFNPAQKYTITEEWLKFVKVSKEQKDCALFVDGGLLSNFPINVFYNPTMPVPRKPTFGVKLEYEEDYESKRIKTLMEFAGSMVSTMRYFYDRDFALKHDIYQKTVRSIDTGKIHWLNFNLSKQEKVELFFRGALTATLFLAKHAMTDLEIQELMNLGRNVQMNGSTFSIYPDEKANFRTEDCLMGNVTFEWHSYKKDRLFDLISKDDRKQKIKEDASLKQVPKESKLAKSN